MSKIFATHKSAVGVQKLCTPTQVSVAFFVEIGITLSKKAYF